jgi:hypothetical protein
MKPEYENLKFQSGSARDFLSHLEQNFWPAPLPSYGPTRSLLNTQPDPGH